MGTVEPPRAAYIHVPFCRHHCGYCNFTLLAGRDDLIAAYLQGLERELAALGEPREVETLFLGGGTPSHLPPPALDRLLTLVKRWFPPAVGYEWSLEANPADLDPPRIAVLAEQGITRVSLGVQSFAAGKLKRLERDHDADVVDRATERVRTFARSLSYDLIFAAPGETLADWERDVQAALARRPEHLSAYGLTYERGAPFWARRARGELHAVDEETERAMYEAAIDALTAAGYEHYEVSNFARPNQRCRHNEVYWLGGEYYAAGPGAARFVGGIRSTNHRSTTTWLKRVLAGESPIAESEALTPDLRARERVVFGLRRLEGVDLGQIARDTGVDVEALLREPLGRYRAQGFVEQAGERLRLTRSGLLISDALWPALLS